MYILLEEASVLCPVEIVPLYCDIIVFHVVLQGGVSNPSPKTTSPVLTAAAYVILTPCY